LRGVRMDKKLKINEKQDNLKEDYQVVKENILNEAKIDPRMKLLEYRLILIAMSKISPLAQEVGYIYFTVKDFCELLEIRKDSMYSYIKKASKSLASRTLTVENKKKKEGITIPWLSEIKYNESLIRIQFNTKLEKHILNIKKENGYTKYFIKNILYLKSKYSVRTYELLKQVEKIGEKKFDLIDFREKIGAVKKSYNQMFAFRKEVLKKVIDEINICTDIIINVEETKENRRVKELIFYIRSKKDLNNNLEIARKDKLILRIQNLIHRKTGHIFEAHHINNIHRKILIEFLTDFESGKYNKVFIHSPEAFFINELKTILEKYDIELLKKKFKDY
jgi:plasmid replication initiation protein